MARQLVLPLPVPTARGRADFVVAAANAEAVRALGDWRTWAFGKLVLAGPEAAGKTHLAHIWAAEAGARLIPAAAAPASLGARPGPRAVEDVPAIAGDAGAETALFHLLNAQAEAGHPTLLTGRGAPAEWGLRLPDLASRIAQARVVTLDQPDDALLCAVMVKLAADRQLALEPVILKWALVRVERSAAAVQRFVDELDRLALEQQRRPTVPLAQAALDASALSR